MVGLPDALGDYVLVVRATDGQGAVQKWEEDRGWFFRGHRLS